MVPQRQRLQNKGGCVAEVLLCNIRIFMRHNSCPSVIVDAVFDPEEKSRIHLQLKGFSDDRVY